MKFFDYFDKLGLKFDKLSSSWNTLDTRKNTLTNARGTSSDISSIDQTAIEQAEKFAKDIDQIEKSMKDLNKEDELWKKHNSELTRLKSEARKMENAFFSEKTRLDKSLEADEKKIMDETVDNLKKKTRSYDSASEAERIFQNDLTKLTKTLTSGGIELEDYDKKAAELYNKKIKQQGLSSTIKTVSGNAFGGAEGQVSSFIGGIGDGFGKLLKMIFPEFAILIDAIVGLFKEALKQIFDASKMFIDITRKTGGLITQQQLGYNNVGMTEGGSESIQHKTIAANVSMDQYKDAIDNLFTGSMGQVSGMRDNLQQAGKDIDNYGIASAKMSKLWNTDITKAVQGLTMGYNLSLKEATSTTEQFTWATHELGLNASTAMSNLERLSNNTGKYYFKSKENMENLALMATKLGVSVDDLLEGTGKANSMTELFAQQQNLAALGLGNTANSVAEVYALQQTGQEDKAIALKQVAIAKDLTSQHFIDKEGNVTKPGIDTLKTAGYSKEMIEASAKIARDSKDAQVSFEVMAGLAKGTAEQEQQKLKWEREHMSYTEKLQRIYNSFIQPLVDMVKGLLGPSITELLDGLMEIGDALAPIFKDFVGAFSLIGTGLGYIVGFLMSVISSVGKLIKLLWGGLQWVVNKVADLLSWIFGSSDTEENKKAVGTTETPQEEHSLLYQMFDVKGSFEYLGEKFDELYRAITGNTDALEDSTKKKNEITEADKASIKNYQQVTWKDVINDTGLPGQKELQVAKAQVSSAVSAKKSSEAATRDAFQNKFEVNNNPAKQTTIVQTHIQVSGVTGVSSAVNKKL